MGCLQGKVVIVTGAASGLGWATSLQVARQGAIVALVDVDADRLREVQGKLQAVSTEDVLSIRADVAKEEDVAAYVERTQEAFGRIDGFFNNAGVEGTQNLTHDYSSQEFERVLAINLNGVFYGLKHVLSAMREQEHGKVVNMASVGGIRGVGNQSGYAASKHGVVGLTRNSAVEYGPYGISVNAVAPGAIMTPMVEASLKQIDADQWEEVGREFVSRNPMRRFGRPEEVARTVTFLLSDGADFINGVVLPIDGGQSAQY